MWQIAFNALLSAIPTDQPETASGWKEVDASVQPQN